MVCFDWGQRFIDFLKSTVRAAGTNAQATQLGMSGGAHELLPHERCTGRATNKPAVWRIIFKPKEGVSVTQLDEIGMQEVEAGEDRVGFLPRWYFDEIRARSESNPDVRSTHTSHGSQRTDHSRNSDQTKKDSNLAPTPSVQPVGWVT